MIRHVSLQSFDGVGGHAGLGSSDHSHRFGRPMDSEGAALGRHRVGERWESESNPWNKEDGAFRDKCKAVRREDGMVVAIRELVDEFIHEPLRKRSKLHYNECGHWRDLE